MKRIKDLFTIGACIVLLLSVSCNVQDDNNSFTINFPEDISRTWLGPEFWANRLQDWEINNSRIECLLADANRNVGLLTCELSSNTGSFSTSVDVGVLRIYLHAIKIGLASELGQKGNLTIIATMPSSDKELMRELPLQEIFLLVLFL